MGGGGVLYNSGARCQGQRYSDDDESCSAEGPGSCAGVDLEFGVAVFRHVIFTGALEGKNMTFSGV